MIQASNQPLKSDIERLTKYLDRYAPREGTFELCPLGLQVVKAFKTSQKSSHTLSNPALCIVTQGSKCVSTADSFIEYNDNNMVVYAAEIPIHVRVTKASVEEPMLCLVIPLDPQHLNELIFKVFPHGVPKSQNAQAIYVGDSNTHIIKSAIRIMDTIQEDDSSELLLPLIIDEIIIRLLKSENGPAIAQIGIVDSNAHKVSKAITWVKENYKKSIKSEDLAKIAGMSLSSFHAHFKSITSMSPLQFQKTLRLYEAKNLIMSRTMDISNAAYEVGYASTSQFSREYSRCFGASPTKDILRAS